MIYRGREGDLSASAAAVPAEVHCLHFIYRDRTFGLSLGDYTRAINSGAVENANPAKWPPHTEEANKETVL